MKSYLSEPPAAVPIQIEAVEPHPPDAHGFDGSQAFPYRDRLPHDAANTGRTPLAFVDSKR